MHQTLALWVCSLTFGGRGASAAWAAAAAALALLSSLLLPQIPDSLLTDCLIYRGVGLGEGMGGGGWGWGGRSG